MADRVPRSDSATPMLVDIRGASASAGITESCVAWVAESTVDGLAGFVHGIMIQSLMYRT